MRSGAWFVVVAACGSSKEPPPAPAPTPREVRSEIEKPIAPPAPPPLANDPWNAPPRPPSESPVDIPDSLAAWMPAKPVEWSGSWRAYLPPEANAMPIEDEAAVGKPFALRIEKNRAVVSDGTSEQSFELAVQLPCAAMLIPGPATGPAIGKEILATKSVAPVVRILDRIAVRFVMRHGRLLVGEGAAGLRRGKTALVCGVMHGEWFVLDDTGRCTKHHARKTSEVACHWDTPSKLVITCPECWHERYVLFAEGNTLVDAQFRRDARPLVADDYDAAKRWAATARSAGRARRRGSAAD